MKLDRNVGQDIAIKKLTSINKTQADDLKSRQTQINKRSYPAVKQKIQKCIPGCK